MEGGEICLLENHRDVCVMSGKIRQGGRSEQQLKVSTYDICNCSRTNGTNGTSWFRIKL